MPQYTVTDPHSGEVRTIDLAISTTPSHAAGVRTPGNIDLYAQPAVPNPDGSTSTVDSFSVERPQGETLLSRVTPDGRHLHDLEAIAEFERTGQHLGVFDTPAHADQYASGLHDDYAAGKYRWPRPVAAHVPQAPMPFLRAPSSGETLKGYGQAAMDWIAGQPVAQAAESVLGSLSPVAALRDAYRAPGGLERISYDPNTYITAGGPGRPATARELGTAVPTNQSKQLVNAERLIARAPKTLGEWLTWHSTSGSPGVFKIAAPRLDMPMSYEQLSAVRDRLGPTTAAVLDLRKLTPQEFLQTPMGREIRQIQTAIPAAAKRAPVAPPAVRRYTPAATETGLVWRPTGTTAAPTIDVAPASAVDTEALVSLPGRPMYVPYKGGKVYVAQHDLDFLKREREFLTQMKRAHSDVGEASEYASRTEQARALNLARDKYLTERKAFYNELGVSVPDRKLMRHLPNDTVKVKEDAPALGGLAAARLKPVHISRPGWEKLVEGFDAKAHVGLGNLHNTLMGRSFINNIPKDRPFETMGAIVTSTGEQVGDVLHGTENFVDIPDEAIDRWVSSLNPVSTAHTHPSSSAFSLNDFGAHEAMRDRGLEMHSMLVFGRDGSWYDLRWPKVSRSLDAKRELIYAHGRAQAKAATQAAATTDEWIQRQGWGVTPDPSAGRMFWRRPDGTGVMVDELLRLHPEIKEFHETQFRNESVKIWEALAPLFQGTFRYHLAPR